MTTMADYPSEPPPWLNGRLEIKLRGIRVRILEALDMAGPAGGWRRGRVRAELNQALDRIDEALRLIENTEVKQ